MYGGDGNPNQGMGVLFDCGMQLGQFEPLVAVDWFKPEGAKDLDGAMLGAHLGLNYWLKGHNVNIKADLGLIKAAGKELGHADRVGLLQTQLLF
jgi:hypothetical protein